MASRTRVSPFGDLLDVQARGTLMGNRGCLHDADGRVVRDFSSYKGWVTCLLSFNGRKRQLRRPGHYTELFFLDEATALAAGHRPCGTCRREALRAFMTCAAPVGDVQVPRTPRDIDAALHKERIRGSAFRQGWHAVLGNVPAGSIITHIAKPSDAWLWHRDRLWPWTMWGYGPPKFGDRQEEVKVLTPPTMTKALANGYTPLMHHSVLDGT